MGKHERSFIFLIVIAFVFVFAGSSPAPPTPTGQSSYLASPSQISSSRLYIPSINETDYAVDISGLHVDFSCAQGASYTTLDNVRIDLLKQGCAKIIGAPIDSAEQAAQAYAQVKHIGLWSPPPKPQGPHQASIFVRFFRWIGAHKLISIPTIGLLLAAVSSPWWVKFVSFIIGLFYKRKVRIVITGATAAGKTGLWLAWRDEYSPGTRDQISNIPVTTGVKRVSIEPVMLQKWTLQPILIDAAGAEPWNVLEAIRRARGIQGAILERRMKRILLYVVAPSSQEGATAADPFDTSYVLKQEGYAHLPMAIIRQRDPKIRPDLVIMFATKFDLLSSIPPNDSDGTAVAKMTAVFEQHRELIESACNEARVPFVWIVGSAKRGWGIDQLRKSLAAVMR